jgi:Ca2+/Na+ antiporter
MYGRFKDVMYDWYNTNCAVDSNAAILCGIINTDCGLLSFQIGEFQIYRIMRSLFYLLVVSATMIVAMLSFPLLIAGYILLIIYALFRG